MVSEGDVAQLTRTMEKNAYGNVEGSSDSEDDFHSASDSPSCNGDLAPSASLLAVQLAVACVHLHQRARSQNGISGLPVHPVGLPCLKKRRSRSTQAIFEGNLQHSSDAPETSVTDGLKQAKNKRETRSTFGMEQFPSLKAGHNQMWSDSCSSSPVEALSASTEVQPWSASTMERISSSREQENPWATSGTEGSSLTEISVPKRPNVERLSVLGERNKAVWPKGCHYDKQMMLNADEGYGYSPTRMSSKKDLQRVSWQEHELERSPACSSNLCQGREDSSCISNHEIGDAGGDDVDTRKGIKEIMDISNLTLKKLLDSQPSSISSSELLKSRSIFTQQGKERRWSSTTPDDKISDTQKNNHFDSSHTTIVSRDGAAISKNRVNQSSDSEGAPANEASEQGQLDSLLLWPVGLAVEAIAFQVRLIAQAFSLVAILFNWCNSFASNRVRETLQAKERATEALSQKVAMISNVPPKVTESGSMVLKRAGWGCFAALYVCILLCMLLFPTLLLDYVFLSKIVEEPVSVKEPLHFDYTLPYPTAVVFLNKSGGKLGRHSEYARPIPVTHKVHITVFLILPESDYNRDLGMFQLTAELLSETGQTIKSSIRPCMLRFHSFPIRMLKSFIISLPSLVGMFTESQTLVVHLMEFEEQPVATSVVRILVQSKAGMPLGKGIPEIYSAHVHIESHLPWLKNMMRNWKWTVYIWTGLMLYVVEVIMILCCCRQALVPKTWVIQNDEVKADQVGSANPVEVHESGLSAIQLRREQGPSRHYSLHEHIPTARAVPYRREHKLSQAGHTSSI